MSAENIQLHNKVSKISLYFGGVFNKKNIIPFMLVGYEIITLYMVCSQLGASHLVGYLSP